MEYHYVISLIFLQLRYYHAFTCKFLRLTSDQRPLLEKMYSPILIARRNKDLNYITIKMASF